MYRWDVGQGGGASVGHDHGDRENGRIPWIGGKVRRTLAVYPAKMRAIEELVGQCPARMSLSRWRSGDRSAIVGSFVPVGGQTRP
jgi:hypothetical protein